MWYVFPSPEFSLPFVSETPSREHELISGHPKLIRKNRLMFVRWRASLNWVHANRGIINGGVACVSAKWRVFVRFCVF